MNMNQELKQLIDYAIADGKISKKERSILIRKAAEVGISEDELMLELGAKLHLAKKDIKALKKKQNNQDSGY